MLIICAVVCVCPPVRYRGWLRSDIVAFPGQFVKGECYLLTSPYLVSRILEIFVQFCLLGELQLWFVNLQPMIKVMLILAFLSVQTNSVL